MNVATVDELVRIGLKEGIPYLEKLLRNDEFLADIWINSYNELKRAIEEPEYGQELLRKKRETLQQLQTNMENTVQAINLLRK